MTAVNCFVFIFIFIHQAGSNINNYKTGKLTIRT